MTNEALLERIQSALTLDTPQVLEAFALGGAPQDSPPSTLDDALLLGFLDGLIVQRRGPRPEGRPPVTEPRNNAVLKKLRVALQLHETALRGALEVGGAKLTKSEFSGLFRSPGHKHYRPCSDEVLHAFLDGWSPLG